MVEYGEGFMVSQETMTFLIFSSRINYKANFKTDSKIDSKDKTNKHYQVILSN